MRRNLRELRDRKKVITPTFQFSIRAVLWVTALTAFAILVVLEIHHRFGPIAVAVTVLAFLSIFAHVAGAALGSRLRASSDDPQLPGDADSVEPHLVQPLKAQKSDFEPATQLRYQKPLKRTPIYYSVGTGAAFGAVVASCILTWYMWDDLAIVNVLFGAVCAALIGGLFGFLFGSLYQVVRNALEEAKDKT